MRCMRTDCPVSTLQMQVSPSVVLRGPRLWNKPGGLMSPYLSQNAMRMEHLPRSDSEMPLLSVPWCLLLFHFPSIFMNHSCPQRIPCHLTGSSMIFVMFILVIVMFWSGLRLLWSVFLLQVQCHTLTGYCWCVTGDGKPVSGSSVHNRTPVCSGTWVNSLAGGGWYAHKFSKVL